MPGVGFLNLPPELRHEVYRYAMRCEHGISVQTLDHSTHSGSKSYSRLKANRPGKPAPCLALLSASKRIKEESISFLCAQNEFFFFDIPSATFFISYLGPVRCQLRSITVQGNRNWKDGQWLLYLAARLPRLTHFQLPLYNKWSHFEMRELILPNGQHVRSFCRILKPWLEVKGDVELGVRALFDLHTVTESLFGACRYRKDPDRSWSPKSRHDGRLCEIKVRKEQRRMYKAACLEYLVNGEEGSFWKLVDPGSDFNFPSS